MACDASARDASDAGRVMRTTKSFAIPEGLQAHFSGRGAFFFTWWPWLVSPLKPRGWGANKRVLARQSGVAKTLLVAPPPRETVGMTT